MKNIKLIEVPSEIGAGTRGASLGIDAIKIAALDFMSNFFVHFPSEKIEVENKILFEPIQSPYAKRIQGVLTMYDRVSKAVSDSMKNHSTPKPASMKGKTLRLPKRPSLGAGTRFLSRFQISPGLMPGSSTALEFAVKLS